MRTLAIVVATSAAMLSGYSSVAAQRAADTLTIERVVNRTHTVVPENGRPIVRLDAKPGDGFAVVKGGALAEGTIELDVRGEDLQQQSFVGVAWAVQNDSTYESVYLRPFNFRTPDTARAKRAVQYVSQPTWPWPRLRAESPGKYEQPVSPVPDP